MIGVNFRYEKYMNGSCFALSQYMNGVGFVGSSRTSVPKIKASYPPPPPWIALGVALGVAVLALVIVVGVLCLKMGRN